MPLIRWTTEMSVGLTELDDDHRTLIKIINHLNDNVGESMQLETVRQCLVALRRYAEFHFAREERVMTACNFPGIDVQRAEHGDFIKRIQKVTKRFDANPEAASSVVNAELLSFLREWFNHHILIEDMAYRPYVENSTEAKSAAKRFKGVEVSWSL